MRIEPGFLKTFEESLALISKSDLNMYAMGTFPIMNLRNMIASQASNLLQVELPSASDFTHHSKLLEDEEELCKLAQQACSSGQVCYVVVSSKNDEELLKRIPGIDMTVLTHAFLQGSPVSIDGVFLHPKKFFISNDSQPVADALVEVGLSNDAWVLSSYRSPKILPNNSLANHPTEMNYVSCGTGDVANVLMRQLAGCTKYIYIVDSNNGLSSLDILLLGRHIKNNNQATVEITTREEHDLGGIPVFSDGRLQTIQSYRLDDEVVCESQYISTNTTVLNVTQLNHLRHLPWYRKRSHVKNKVFDHFERNISQFTEALHAEHVLVDRNTKYLPLDEPSNMQKLGTIFNGNA